MKTHIMLRGPRRNGYWSFCIGLTYRRLSGYPPQTIAGVAIEGSGHTQLVVLHLLLVAVGFEFEGSIPKRADQ